MRGSEPIDPIIEYGHKPQKSRPTQNFPITAPASALLAAMCIAAKKFPRLRGVYIYGDYQMGTIWGLRYENGKLTADDVLVPANAKRTIPSFAEDSNGEVYVVSFDGTIYEFVEAGEIKRISTQRPKDAKE